MLFRNNNNTTIVLIEITNVSFLVNHFFNLNHHHKYYSKYYLADAQNCYFLWWVLFHVLYQLGKWCSWSRKELICWSCFVSQEVFLMICLLYCFSWSYIFYEAPLILNSIFLIAFCFISCSYYHFKEGLRTDLHYLLSTGVYSRWLLFFWLTLFFRHLQRKLQSSLPNSDYYSMSPY